MTSIKFAEKEMQIKAELKNSPNVLTIVEGKKDEKVLLKLGFNKIFAINGQSIPAAVEKIKQCVPESVVILTDFDSEGRKKAAMLTKLLQKNQILVNFSFRKKIKTIFNVEKIEEIKFFTKILDHYGDVNSANEKIFNRKVFYNKSLRDKKISQQV